MESKEINCKYIAVRGKVEIDKSVSLGDDLKVVVTVTSIEDKDNEDGTVDRTFKCRLFAEVSQE